MDDDRLRQAARELELPDEALDLLRARRVLLEEVEPGLADADALGRAAQRLDLGARARVGRARVVRVDARGRVEVRVLGAQLEGHARGRHVGADHDHPSDPRRARARQDLVAVRVEAAPVHVRVAVGDHRQESFSMSPRNSWKL